MNKESVIHFVSGGVGGACGAAVINPLEVVKTRLQSSQRQILMGHSRSVNVEPCCTQPSQSANNSLELRRGAAASPARCFRRFQTYDQVRHMLTVSAQKRNPLIVSCLKKSTLPPVHRQLLNIVENEGFLALWKGFGTTLVGVFPSRAIYFAAYSNAKLALNHAFIPESMAVHTLSAAFAGFCCTTITNPLWMIRTRLQLDSRNTNSKFPFSLCMRKIYDEFGLRGFYRGVTASYLGIIETVMHFVIYERLKRSSFLAPEETNHSQNPSNTAHYFRYMVCASLSRMVAATVGYPHEVLRTRLREENSRYKGLLNTALLIRREEGWKALYGGLSVHLLRTVPNTAITMATYELLVMALSQYTS